MGSCGNHELTTDSHTLPIQIPLMIQQHAPDFIHIFTGDFNANKSGSERVAKLKFYNF